MTTFLDRVGAAPISWGICEAPGWGPQLPADRVLAEAAGLGITAIEQGAIGWLPTDPAERRATLERHGLRLLGGFVPLVLHEPGRSGEALARAREVAANLAAGGATYVVTAVVGDDDEWVRPAMTAGSWAEVFANLARLDGICGEAGLVQAVHPHVDTLIETGDEFQRFLDSCDTRFCLDTGHLTIGGTDVVAVASRHHDRIEVVHLKDLDATTMARERSGELDLMGATQAGLFPPLGDGTVPLGQIVRILESSGYQGWYVMETDVALTDDEPPPGQGPVQGVARSLAHLRTLGPAGAGDRPSPGPSGPIPPCRS